ncbi:MBL fold metallo-hydrolase [Halorarius litoreus]|uniref:MBL fold metallo-hydrolase n=1 Tax=Halorarius litoreus TaxID=2962676 RepID=UPI0020CD2628|nr:MBL fold metallo-hydrolase [Halorarius litoreus]
MVSVRLVRHATLDLDFGSARLVVDPMLAAPGEMDPIENSPNQQPNPLVDLPSFDTQVFDAIVVTHLHDDHLDQLAKEVFPTSIPVFCQPEDEQALAETFDDVRVVDEAVTFDGVTITRTPARHGHGDLVEAMGPVSGFVFDDGTERVYVAGDTVWYDEIDATLDAYGPDVAIVNAGAAQFLEGDPITMTKEEVAAFARATEAHVVAVHMDAINHCLLSREELTAYLEQEGLSDRVTVPADGEVAR